MSISRSQNDAETARRWAEEAELRDLRRLRRAVEEFVAYQSPANLKLLQAVLEMARETSPNEGGGEGG